MCSGGPGGSTRAAAAGTATPIPDRSDVVSPSCLSGEMPPMTPATSTLLDRFLRYVRIDTQADDRSSTYPSTLGQLVLGAMLRDELLALGLADARQDEHGVVIATVPGNVPGAPTIAFNA